MKATGIIRRIDDLGRVVIPKEIRRSMRIKEGDPLEIFTGYDGEVIFRKYEIAEDEEVETLEDFNQPVEMPINPKSKNKRTDYELQAGDYRYLLHLTEDEEKLMNWLYLHDLLDFDAFEKRDKSYDEEYGWGE